MCRRNAREAFLDRSRSTPWRGAQTRWAHPARSPPAARARRTFHLRSTSGYVQHSLCGSSRRMNGTRRRWMQEPCLHQYLPPSRGLWPRRMFLAHTEEGLQMAQGTGSRCPTGTPASSPAVPSIPRQLTTVEMHHHQQQHLGSPDLRCRAGQHTWVRGRAAVFLMPSTTIRPTWGRTRPRMQRQGCPPWRHLPWSTGPGMAFPSISPPRPRRRRRCRPPDPI